MYTYIAKPFENIWINQARVNTEQKHRGVCEKWAGNNQVVHIRTGHFDETVFPAKFTI
jgi:hypothetical protein